VNRFRILLVVLIVPVAIGLAVTALQLAWLPSLPASIVTHWSGTRADGTGPAWSLILITAGVSLVIPGIITAAVLGGGGTVGGAFPGVTKVGAVLSPFTVGLISVSITAGLALQLGSAGGLAHAPDVGPWIGAGAGIGLVLAVAAWFALPPARRLSQVVDDAPPLPLADDERAVWVGRAHPSSVGTGVLAGVIVVLVGIATYVVAISEGRASPVVVIPIVIGILLVAFLNWRVRIDARGLVVRGLLGGPVIRVRPADVTRVAAIDVRPMAYGGWGLRGAPGTTIGVITRRGEGIVVGRRHRGDLVVTVDDAESAARLLSALASRASAGRGTPG
jgi:hypothetical protein